MSAQFVMTSIAKRLKSALPYAFTEHGVTMLASVLRVPKARQMNIAIMRAFIRGNSQFNTMTLSKGFRI